MSDIKTQEELLAKGKAWSFNSIATFYIAGKGKAFSVRLPITCYNFEWILNREVLIDNHKHTVIGVEKQVHAAPWYMGEQISLLIQDYTSI